MLLNFAQGVQGLSGGGGKGRSGNLYFEGHVFVQGPPFWVEKKKIGNGEEKQARGEKKKKKKRSQITFQRPLNLVSLHFQRGLLLFFVQQNT